jgi:hypothetical protein
VLPVRLGVLGVTLRIDVAGACCAIRNQIFATKTNTTFHNDCLTLAFDEIEKAL